MRIRVCTEYRVVKNYSVDTLNESVKELLADGWEPKGAAQVYTPPNRGIHNETYFIQTMIRWEYVDDGEVPF